MNFLLAVDWGHVVESLFGVAVGGAIALTASIIVQRMQSTQAQELQIKQLRHDRKQQRKQWNYEQDVEHAWYQRDTVAELQAHLDEFVSTALAIDEERMSMYRNATDEQLEAGEIETSEHYRELAKRYRDAQRQVKVLGVRIEKDAIRKQLDDIHRLALQLANTPPGQWELLRRAAREAGDPWKDPSYEIVDLAIDANKALGTAIRTRALIVRPD